MKYKQLLIGLILFLSLSPNIDSQMPADPFNMCFAIGVNPSGFCEIMIECMDRSGNECNTVGAAFVIDLCIIAKMFSIR